MTPKLAALLLIPFAFGVTLIDQISVVVGRHAIKTSDINRDLRVTEFLNGQASDSTLTQKRAAAQRLIDQELIHNEIIQEGTGTQFSAETKALLDQIRTDRFKGSESEMVSELRKRGLTLEQLTQQLNWQLTVLRFIDQRFRPGVIVQDSDIHSYFDQHEAELKRKYPSETTLEALAPHIREIIEGDRINRNFEEWLQQARESAHLEFKVEELK